MEAYKNWVRHNRRWVASMESIANTLTWFLPDRFSNTEIGPEAVTAFVGLLTVMNQHIIETGPKFSSQTGHILGNRPPPVVADEQRRFPWPVCLSAVKEMEVLIEVAAEHYQGQDSKWTVLATVEAIKALLRLIILHGSGYKMLLDGGETKHTQECLGPTDRETTSSSSLTGRERNRRPESYFSLDDSRNSGEGFQNDPRSSLPRDLEGRALQALARFGESAGATARPSWLGPQQMPSENSSDTGQVACASKSTLFTIWEQKGLVGETFVLGEVLLILRPLIYTLLIRRYGLRSWKPWVTSLAVDVTGMSILFIATHFLKKNAPLTIPSDQQRGPLSSLEKQELKRRQLLWTLYLMRDPFFSRHTRHPLESAEKLFRPLPLIGLLAGKVVELVSGVQTRYSYTSAS